MKKFISISLIFVTLIFSACKSGSKVDRTHAPAAGPAPKIQIGNYQVATMDNGLKLIVVENHKLPRLSYSIHLDVDPILEGEKAGYVGMAGDLLGTGTSSRTKAQIDESVDYLGASLNTSATSVSGNCLKKHSDEFLALMSDVLLHPTFSQEELEKMKKKMLSSLANDKTSANSLSEKIGSVMSYGKNHPYGEQMSEETIGRITRDDLVNYYTAYFKPNIAYLIVVGDITFDQAKAEVDKHFSTWHKGDVKKSEYKKPTFPATNRVVFVPLPGAVQSVIDVTYPVDILPGTSDAITASVLNNVLGGGGFQTRLMQNLREGKAYTYGAYSEISPDDVIGRFSAGASVRNAVTDSAVKEILFEMNRLVTEPIPDSTLQLVKNIMTGNFARSLERPQTVANFALNIQKYKLPADYYETYLQKLNAVTSADLQAMAKKVVKPENAYITVVGNKEVAEKLAKFAGNGKVEIMNADGTEFSELQPAPAGVTVQSVLENYVAARGGIEVLSKVKSFEQIGTMSLGGMSLSLNIKMKDSNKFRMAVNMGQMEMMLQVMNGDKGYMAQMGQKEVMDESMREDLILEADMLAALNYAKYGLTATLKGIDKVEKEDAYVVEVKKKNGESVTDYYSVSSGLKLKSLSVGGESGMMAETNYMEYITFSGVKYASKQIQSADGQQIVLSITEMKVNPKLDDKDFAVE